MRGQTMLTALTATNLTILIGLAAGQILPATAQPAAQMLRGSGLEIVDAEGRVRASIGIQPPAGSEGETVLLRLIDENGQPSVKIATSLARAGLSLVGGDDQSYLILEAVGPQSRLRLVEPGGLEQVVEP